MTYTPDEQELLKQLLIPALMEARSICDYYNENDPRYINASNFCRRMNAFIKEHDISLPANVISKF